VYPIPMFWADEIVEGIKTRFSAEIEKGRPLIIRDEKTLSGRVHVGSLRGIIIHGVLAQILSEKNIANKYLFELNDSDPMDGLPSYVDEKTFRPHMGKPLFRVPGINECDENFSTGFGQELKDAVNSMGLPIEWYPLRPLYDEGRFNDVIIEALNGAKRIREIYKEVSGGSKPDDWYPLNVICPKCGKIGTTQVIGWDGKEVTFECKEKYVDWAEGCRHTGSMSPFDGNATLPWKVEWAAKWKVIGVHIEAAGKDHYASGGSREIAANISKEIFHYPEPFGFLYEWLNIKGKSMSSSKGVGMSAIEMSKLLPPKILKFLMIRKEQNQPIEFDPGGRTIPNLFDEYDRCSDHFFNRIKDPYDAYARAFALAQIDLSKDPEDLFEMRFQALSFIVQMPHLNLEEEANTLKGSPVTAEEKSALTERAQYVESWLKNLAPEEFRYEILNTPPKDLTLEKEQKAALNELKNALKETSVLWEGPKIHECIHAVKENTEIAPKKLFEPLYQMFLGRSSGPQVGWFLSTFERERVCIRLEEVST
jgi:lysyl-tRNA synthetase, class I